MKPKIQSAFPSLQIFLFGALSFSFVATSAEPTGHSESATHGFREIQLAVPATGQTGFAQLAPADTGLNFTNVVSDKTSREHQTIINAGLAAGDVDGDGLVDLYLCRMDGGNALYRNLGHWKFEEITTKAGVACKDRHSMGAVFADVNGDGAVDLLVLGYGGPNSLFINDGKGNFAEEMSFPGRSSTNGSISAAFADIDGNGTLDVYIANHRYHTIKETLTEEELRQKLQPDIARISNGQRASPEFLERFTAFTKIRGVKISVDDVQENGEPDELYLNDGKGHFTRVSQEKDRFKDENGNPIVTRDWSLGVQIRDINGDGFPDIYTCSDFFTPDRLWLNDGEGNFRLAPKFTQRHQSQSSMGVDFADINRDGQVDFMTCEMLSRDHERQKRQMGVMKPTPVKIGVFDDAPQIMQNCLFLNRGDNTFAEIAMHAGVKASEWSWSPVFLDVDLDGYEDILVSTGTVRDNMDSDVLGLIRNNPPKTIEEYRAAQMLFPQLHTQNFIFRNRGDLTFEDVSEAWGFKGLAVSGGMIFADLDNDGDLDVVINTVGSPVQIYRNETIAPRVAVQLKGLAPNTQGIGAKLTLWDGPVPQGQEIIAGGHYASCSQPMRVFAAGSAHEMGLAVLWRSGKRSVVTEVKPNHLYIVDEAGAKAFPAPSKSPPTPMFEDVSAKLAHKHADAEFDDFRRQPLLPNRLSQLGPGMAWFDLNNDGHEDLIIASGSGGNLGVFLGDGKGGFTAEKNSLFAAERDQTTVLGLKIGKDASLLVGNSNFETSSTNVPAMLNLQFAAERGWSAGENLPPDISSTGPLALGDINGDGALDLFVGGRTIPGKYPVAASSKIYLKKNGRFELDEKNSATFKDLGLVSAAVLGDLDGDGSQDLVLAMEWGPIRVFLNKNGMFTEATKDLGLDKFPGWWNGVTLGDFDGDGQLDIAASNWGNNSKYEGTYDSTYPLTIYHGDFDQSGTYDLVEAYHDVKMGKLVPVRGLSCSSRAMPFVKKATPTYEKFGQAGCSEIYGDKLAKAQKVEAHYLLHTVFLNRKKTFEAMALPLEAQLSTGFGICVADFDGDGVEDLFLAQNIFAVQIETPRHDAGRGLLLKGKGDGNFEAVPGQLSGILVYGEQRGAAICDFDQDGRVDLAVTQNGAETKLYRNMSGKVGLRIRLNGPAENPTGVGAVIRLVFGARTGPARAVLAGSGYWSQDSAVQVLAGAEKPDGVWVHWPGGKETLSAVPAGAQEITVNVTGEVKVALR